MKLNGFIGRCLSWIADRISKERFDITRMWSSDDYLTRWTLMGKRFNTTNNKAVFLHRFRRSDADEMHDHPWPFTSVILAGGYWEVTPAPGWKDGVGPTRRKWYGPGSVLRRPARWIHSVMIPDGCEAWTVVTTGFKERSWGFWCPSGYTPWREHQARTNAGVHGCG